MSNDTIFVRRVDDIHVVNHRYALIQDTSGTWRVVSLVRKTFRELQARKSINGLSYSFDRTGLSPSYSKECYNQPQLQCMARSYGRTVSSVVLEGLLKDGVIRVEQDVRIHTGTKPYDMSGLPRFDNYQIDPDNGGWIIATITEDGLLFGSKPKVHTVRGDAEAELQRLASVSQGTEFVLLKAVKTAVSQTIKIKTFA